ncbi:hypothetical protein GCM10010102_04280 [Promicromonospora citrea]|uniref:HEPN domain-containing protein n=1 Tax=Promicromonospora citrea TaxID=43677 RepID=A0A8H9GEH3_9MICO|nr:hypothetical protein GCM10010102_04280 [Promicromonospora citrea]
MTPRRMPRTRAMTRGDVRVRAATARKYQEVGEMVLGEDPEERQVAGGLAALAAIAAADAICGARLGRCATGQDHGQAEDLLATVNPGGKDLARKFARVLSAKSSAHYGTTYLTTSETLTMVRCSRALVDAIEAHVD